jgi:bacillopeptidase F (M6 metalloprotease family)
MDAHGPVRTDTAISPIPYGCANQLCHLGFYIEAGLSSYYAANSCATCHGPNIVPLAPYQGSYMWKSGSWTDGADLVTALTLDLGVALPAMSSLDFKSYYDIESGWDYGYVQVSTDGGGSWASLAGSITTTTNPNGRNLGNGITGASAGWADAHFDLSAYAGQTVKIRFNYVTDAYVYGEGWFIDVVSLGPAGAPLFSDDVETLKPEWTVTSNRTTRWSR